MRLAANIQPVASLQDYVDTHLQFTARQCLKAADCICLGPMSQQVPPYGLLPQEAKELRKQGAKECCLVPCSNVLAMELLHAHQLAFLHRCSAHLDQARDFSGG